MKQINPDLTMSYKYLYPRFTILISSGTIKNSNALTIAWSSPLSVNPPLIGVSISDKRYSHEIIKRYKEFVINIPNHNQIDESYFIGQISGREKPKKVQLAGFSLEASNKVKAPRIKECLINLECKLIDIVPTGDHDLFIGEVLEIAIDSSIQDNWAFDLKKFEPIYWRQSKIRRDAYSLSTRHFGE